MRALLCLCLASGLLAGELPQPGRDQAFLARILADTKEGSQPWKAFKMPEPSGSAVVEVVGEYTPAELREVAFQEFLVWFQEDLRRFRLEHGWPALMAGGRSSQVPLSGNGSALSPRLLPLLRVGF